MEFILFAIISFFGYYAYSSIKAYTNTKKVVNMLETKEDIVGFLEANSIDGTEAAKLSKDFNTFLNHLESDSATSVPIEQQKVTKKIDPNKFTLTLWKDLCNTSSDEERYEVLYQWIVVRRWWVGEEIYLNIIDSFYCKHMQKKARELFNYTETVDKVVRIRHKKEPIP